MYRVIKMKTVYSRALLWLSNVGYNNSESVFMSLSTVHLFFGNLREKLKLFQINRFHLNHPVRTYVTLGPSWAIGRYPSRYFPRPYPSLIKKEAAVVVGTYCHNKFYQGQYQISGIFFSKRQREMYIRCPSPKYENGF